MVLSLGLYFAAKTLGERGVDAAKTLGDRGVDAAKTLGGRGGGSSGGTGGGGGGTGGGHGGCVERGTPVEYPAGTSLVEETELPCGEWICFAGEGGAYITVHPDTLVSVWKRAKDLELGDLLDSGDEGEIQSIVSVTELLYAGVKVKRRVEPSHTYRARGYRLHNIKANPN